MTPEDLIAKRLAQQEFWVDMGDKRRVRMRRPFETQMHRLRHELTSVDFLVEHSVGWEGFDEAFILGPSIGSATAVPFSADLWRVVMSDSADARGKCVDAIAAAVNAHLEKKAAAAKN